MENTEEMKEYPVALIEDLVDVLEAMLMSYGILTGSQSPFAGDKVALGVIRGLFLNTPREAHDLIEKFREGEE